MQLRAFERYIPLTTFLYVYFTDQTFALEFEKKNANWSVCSYVCILPYLKHQHREKTEINLTKENGI